MLRWWVHKGLCAALVGPQRTLCCAGGSTKDSVLRWWVHKGRDSSVCILSTSTSSRYKKVVHTNVTAESMVIKLLIILLEHIHPLICGNRCSITAHRIPDGTARMSSPKRNVHSCRELSSSRKSWERGGKDIIQLNISCVQQNDELTNSVLVQTILNGIFRVKH